MVVTHGINECMGSYFLLRRQYALVRAERRKNGCTAMQKESHWNDDLWVLIEMLHTQTLEIRRKNDGVSFEMKVSHTHC